MLQQLLSGLPNVIHTAEELTHSIKSLGKRKKKKKSDTHAPPSGISHQNKIKRKIGLTEGASNFSSKLGLGSSLRQFIIIQENKEI